MILHFFTENIFTRLYFPEMGKLPLISKSSQVIGLERSDQCVCTWFTEVTKQNGGKPNAALWIVSWNTFQELNFYSSSNNWAVWYTDQSVRLGSGRLGYDSPSSWKPVGWACARYKHSVLLYQCCCEDKMEETLFESPLEIKGDRWSKKKTLLRCETSSRQVVGKTAPAVEAAAS